jgi:hypothetical protein
MDTRSPAGTDLMAEDIAEAVNHLQDGRATLARRRLAALWPQLRPDGGHARHRSAVAHWLAAVEPEPRSKLAWDERALDEAEAVADWASTFAGTAGTVARMYPELHLELARDHLQRQDVCSALEHLARARNATETLPVGARRQLRTEIRSVDRQLSGVGSGPG